MEKEYEFSSRFVAICGLVVFLALALGIVAFAVGSAQRTHTATLAEQSGDTWLVDKALRMAEYNIRKGKTERAIYMDNIVDVLMAGLILIPLLIMLVVRRRKIFGGMTEFSNGETLKRINMRIHHLAGGTVAKKYRN